MLNFFTQVQFFYLKNSAVPKHLSKTRGLHDIHCTSEHRVFQRLNPANLLPPVPPADTLIWHLLSATLAHVTLIPIKHDTYQLYHYSFNILEKNPKQIQP